MKRMQTITQWRVLAVVLLALCGAVTCRADWAQAESPDFPLDTTVPEPELMALGVLGAITLVRRARRKAALCVACGVLTLAAGRGYAGRVVVTNVTAQQRADEAVVDIRYDLLNPSGGLHEVWVEVSTNRGASYLSGITNFSGAVRAEVTTGEHKQVVWNAAADLAGVTGVVARVRVTAWNESYLVIDVSGGPEATNYAWYYLYDAPPQDDVHKTSKIVLRKIPAGTFVMGSPTNELGRGTKEGPQHMVMLTQPFYSGMYEITQAQYSNVMASSPSYFKQGVHVPKRPVEQVTWGTVRGGTWPGGVPGSNSFMGKLRSKTGLLCDLPTEAQWEYACRAGTTNALNNNTNLQSTEQDANMDILGRYWYNGGSQWSSDPVNGAHAPVGSYLSNQWGLYDMHGNVAEWCLDWYYPDYYGSVTNPVGPVSGFDRVIRGGGWISNAAGCRSARRSCSPPTLYFDNTGFRLVVPASN